MLWIDNRLMSSIGLAPSRISGHLSAPGATRVREGVAGTAAPVIGARGAAPEGLIVIGAYAKPSAFTDRGPLVDTIEAAYGGGMIRQLRTVDRPGVTTPVLLDGPAVITEIPQAPGLTLPRFFVELKFLRVLGGSVAWPAAGPVLLGTSRVAIPGGSMPSTGQLLAWGYTSPLVITYTPANGLAATTWTITQAVASGEHIAADLETGDVYLQTASARTKVTAVTGTRPALDTGHALGTLNPGLTLSSGTGLLLPQRRYRQ